MTKKEINFYQIDDIITKSLAPLLLKVLEENKKALVFCKDKVKIKEIDDGLWVFGKTKFIPHVTIFEKDIEQISDWKRQPIVISDEEVNKNSASYLVLTCDCTVDFVKNFERSFYFYDVDEFANVKNFVKNFDDEFKINSYKKYDGKWQVVSL